MKNKDRQMVNTITKEIEKEIIELYGEYSSLYQKVTTEIKKKYPSVLNLPLDKIAEVQTFNSGWNIETDEIEVVVVGAGGTGGYLIRDLARFIYSVEQRIQGRTKLSMVVVDGDIVETKNVLRQNFLQQDIGQNKAEVLANRHTRAFGINISYVPEMYSYDNGMRRIIEGNKKRIFVGCVDNNEARRQIAKSVAECWNSYGVTQNCFWIDSGNERKSGQVIVGSKDLMDVSDLYPEILLPRHDSVEQVSCADRMLQDEQNMFVNLTASNLILNYVKNIMLDLPMITHGSVFNIDNKFDNYYIKQKGL